jgi:hypothetical protein
VGESYLFRVGFQRLAPAAAAAPHQVEDIIDSGHTLNRLGKLLSAAGAQSVAVVALLDKKGRRRVEFFPDYCGWEVGSLVLLQLSHITVLCYVCVAISCWRLEASVMVWRGQRCVRMLRGNACCGFLKSKFNNERVTRGVACCWTRKGGGAWSSFQTTAAGRWAAELLIYRLLFLLPSVAGANRCLA